MSASDSRHRRNALSGKYAASACAANGLIGVTFELRANLRLINLRRLSREVCARSAFPLPRSPNTVLAVPGGQLLWLGPDEWLLIGESSIPEILDNWDGAATDVSHGRCVLRIGGNMARELLASGISLDLDSEAFPPGTCAQTHYAGVGVLLVRLNDDERKDARFDLYIPRSYALHLWEMLRHAAAEFGYATH